jgi:hypothetical protein
VLTLVPGGGAVSLAFHDLGPGTIGFTVASGPPSGQYLTVMSLNQGAYPNGWFFGIDVLPFELDLMLSWGYPVSGHTFGPVGGAPSGMSIYGVPFGFAPGSPVPTTIGAPATTTIP